MTENKDIASFKDLLPDAPQEVQDKLQGLMQPELQLNPEEPQQIKAVLSDKIGSWKKHEAEGLTSWVRRGGLATVEGNGEEGWIAIVPSKELGGGKLGPFKKAGLAKHAAEKYLHEQGFVYYREDVKKMNEQIRLTMRRNRISRKM